MIEWFRNLNHLYNLIRPVLDVSILAFIIYKAYDLLVKTQAIQIIKGAGLLFICYGLAYFLKLTTLLWVLNFLAPGLFIAIAIVFQPELRKIFLRLGQGELFHLASQPTQTVFEPVLTAAEILSKQKRGALFVFARRVNLRTYIESGTRLNAELCSNLLIT
ncbi:MAG: TIGR00159 family protein, partial [Breznakiellaceae bacterium]